MAVERLKKLFSVLYRKSYPINCNASLISHLELDWRRAIARFDRCQTLSYHLESHSIIGPAQWF
jgi:hypothetical protein